MRADISLNEKRMQLVLRRTVFIAFWEENEFCDDDSCGVQKEARDIFTFSPGHIADEYYYRTLPCARTVQNMTVNLRFSANGIQIKRRNAVGGS